MQQKYSTVGRAHPSSSRRRIISVAFATMGLIVPLGACGGDDGAANDPNTVTVWFNGESVPEDKFAALEEEHGITVKFDIRGDAILTDLLRMRDAGETLPDLIEIDSQLMPVHGGRPGRADDRRHRDVGGGGPQPFYATVPSSVWEDGTYDGEILHWPNKSLVDAMYYNIDLLEEAGVEPPPYDTYLDLLEAARAVKAAIPDLPAYYGTGGTSQDRMFRWLNSFGTPFEGPVPQLTSEQGVATIDWLQTMHDEGITDPEFMIGQQDEAKGAFVAGEMPFIDEGLNGGPGFMLDDFVYGENWATAPSPIDEANGGQEIGFPRGWSMTKGTENTYEASLVLRYLAEPEIAAERYLEVAGDGGRHADRLGRADRDGRRPGSARRRVSTAGRCDGARDSELRPLWQVAALRAAVPDCLPGAAHPASPRCRRGSSTSNT